MATKVIEVPVCDICESEDDVQTVELVIAGQAYELDVCAEHRAELESYADKGRPIAGRRSGASRQRKRAATSDLFRSFDFDPKNT